jgi:sensor histidine kinase regulating citrate/malate metabolism
MKIEIDMHFANNVFTIQFKDNGPGVKGVEEDKIFDYGVTSKEEDGLGIGLFYVYEIIVNQLNGYIRYFRSKGNTVFELVIPNNFK